MVQISESWNRHFEDSKLDHLGHYLYNLSQIAIRPCKYARVLYHITGWHFGKPEVAAWLVECQILINFHLYQHTGFGVLSVQMLLMDVCMLRGIRIFVYFVRKELV